MIALIDESAGSQLSLWTKMMRTLLYMWLISWLPLLENMMWARLPQCDVHD